MESPKSFPSAPTVAADQALQSGNVVVPGTSVKPPPASVRPSVTTGDIDKAKGDIGPAANKDGKGNSATQPAVGAGATPKSEPAQS
jgi:hypothetical protein